jgi:hypothetical protein
MNIHESNKTVLLIRHVRTVYRFSTIRGAFDLYGCSGTNYLFYSSTLRLILSRLLPTKADTVHYFCLGDAPEPVQCQSSRNKNKDHSVPGKRPWALYHNSQFFTTWVLTIKLVGGVNAIANGDFQAILMCFVRAGRPHLTIYVTVWLERHVRYTLNRM